MLHFWIFLNFFFLSFKSRCSKSLWSSLWFTLNLAFLLAQLNTALEGDQLLSKRYKLDYTQRGNTYLKCSMQETYGCKMAGNKVEIAARRIKNLCYAIYWIKCKRFQSTECCLPFCKNSTCFTPDSLPDTSSWCTSSGLGTGTGRPKLGPRCCGYIVGSSMNKCFKL